MKLAIIDLDGVVANAEARFAHAEEIKQTYLKSNQAIRDGFDAKQKATDLYWREVFNPEYVPLDTLIDGAVEAINAIEDAGYAIYFLTSRPEHMREASLAWLQKHKVYINRRGAIDRLIMKSPGFQYVKTVVWKAGIVQTLEALYGATDLLIVDDEQTNIDEHLKYFSNVQTREICKSLAEAVAKLNGTWVEPDPFLPPE